MFLPFFLVNPQEIIAQNVIDNEILADNNNNDDVDDDDNDNGVSNDENKDNDDNDNDNDINPTGEDNTNPNEFVVKPLVHVSIEGTEINDKIRGGSGDDSISGEDGNDKLQGLEGDDEIDGGEGEDIIDGGQGGDELKGGKGADRFICDTTDKIIDYNSLEQDIINGQCEYEDKGLVPQQQQQPIPNQDPLFSNLQSQDNNIKSFANKNSLSADSKDLSFEKFISKFIDMDIIDFLR